MLRRSLSNGVFAAEPGEVDVEYEIVAGSKAAEVEQELETESKQEFTQLVDKELKAAGAETDVNVTKAESNVSRESLSDIDKKNATWSGAVSLHRVAIAQLLAIPMACLHISNLFA